MAARLGVARAALTVTLLALALAGCERTAPDEAPADAPAAGTADPPGAMPSGAASASAELPNLPITDLAALAGEYRVAGAGGRGIDLPHAITARIDDTGVSFQSDCVQLSWVWFFEDARLVTEQLFPRESCGRPLLPEEEAITAAMNAATGIGRTPANGIEIGGLNGAVLLFSQ